jgi:hypothetical protein
MTASELKEKVDNTGSNFFDRSSMRFFGDTMSNYKVYEAKVDTWTRKGVECWELIRRNPVKNGLQTASYFQKGTFKRVHARLETC